MSGGAARLGMQAPCLRASCLTARLHSKGSRCVSSHRLYARLPESRVGSRALLPFSRECARHARASP